MRIAKHLCLLVTGIFVLFTLSASSVFGQAARQPLDAAIAAQERYTDFLLSVSGVVGTAVGHDRSGRPVVKIFTETAAAPGLPDFLDGVPVIVQVTGKLHALHHNPGHAGGPPGGGGGGSGGSSEPSNTDGWVRPVPIGISTGNINECSAGTIAARVTVGSNVFALSNNHVYARENKASIGEEVLQPGRYDTNCAADPGDVIGQLFDFEPIKFDGSNNTIDAAIASSSTSVLGKATPSDGYGTPKTAIASAVVGQNVQKYGRTSSLTKGVITGINATVRVGYSSGTAKFVDQIIVESGKPFIKSGDSGSLLVTDPGSNPVGLLYAGDMSGKLAVANRIDHVLTSFNANIDGQ